MRKLAILAVVATALISCGNTYTAKTIELTQFNTATYKEVWGGTAVKWLMLIAEF